mmetsp:Transcript_116132/g.339590  ORF Transcript_116132/g.339590 Transcript_116132/m.339590 type:complete len:249 (-) Transcript_116132:1019-1765(-)
MPRSTRPMNTDSTSCLAFSSTGFPRIFPATVNAILPPSSAGTGRAFKRARLRLTDTKNIARPMRPSASVKSEPCFKMPTGPTISPEAPEKLNRPFNAASWSPSWLWILAVASPAASRKSLAFKKMRSVLPTIETPKRWNPVEASVKGTMSNRNSLPARSTSTLTGSFAGNLWMKSTVAVTLWPGAWRSRSPIWSSTSFAFRPVRSTASSPRLSTRMPGNGFLSGTPVVSAPMQRVVKATTMFVNTPPA